MSKKRKKTAKDTRKKDAKLGQIVHKTVKRNRTGRSNKSLAWVHPAEIVKAYQSGKTLRDLVPWVKKTFRIVVSHQTISDILKAEGLNLRRRGGHKKSPIWQHAAEIAEKYKRGGTSTIKLAAKYGVSSGNISAILKSQGVKPNPFIARKSSKAWEHKSEIIKDYFQEKIPQLKLAAKYSCSLTTLGKILKTSKKYKGSSKKHVSGKK